MSYNATAGSDATSGVFNLRCGISYKLGSLQNLNSTFLLQNRTGTFAGPRQTLLATVGYGLGF